MKLVSTHAVYKEVGGKVQEKEELKELMNIVLSMGSLNTVPDKLVVKCLHPEHMTQQF